MINIEFLVLEELTEDAVLQEKFINDPEVLLAAAVGAGFDSEEAAVFIANPQAGKTEVYIPHTLQSNINIQATKLL